MIFTKEKCEREIFLAPIEPLPSTDQVCIKYPIVFNRVTLVLEPTDFLLNLADELSEKKVGYYEFFLGINDYCKIDTCIECLPYIVDEETGESIDIDLYGSFYIDLDEFDMANLYERLNELCLEKYGKSCEEMLRF